MTAKCSNCNGSGITEAPCCTVRWYGPPGNQIALRGIPVIAIMPCISCDPGARPIITETLVVHR